MPLSQDLLSRIIAVEWPSGKNMLVLYAQVGQSVSAPGAADPDIAIAYDCPIIGLSEESLEDPIPGSFTRTNYRRPLWEEGRKLEDYAYHEERDEETNSTTYHFIDRARYYVQNGAELVTSADNGTGGIAIPFTMDYTGNSTPDGDFPLFLSPPADLFAVAEAQASVAGLPGFGWLPVLAEELASHDEVTDVTTKVVLKSRLLFIDISKVKAANPDLAELVFDVHITFIGGTAEQEYAGRAIMGSYEKTVMDGENVYTDDDPVDPDFVWPLLEGQPDLLDLGPSDFPNGFPAYLPPNDAVDPPYNRFPFDEPGWFEDRTAQVEEQDKPPVRIRFHINMNDDFSLTSELVYDFEEP